MSRRVQDVRELSVKKSLLAQESAHNGRNTDQRFMPVSAFNKAKKPAANFVKDYETRTLVN